MRLGIQLFGCMKLYNENPDDFLTRLYERGYRVIEPCVSFGDTAIPFAWHAAGIDAHVQRAAKIGLELDSFHSFAGEFWKLIPEHIAACKQAGFKRVVLGYRDAFTREAADAFSAHVIEFADALAEQDIDVWLHNSWQEIAAKIDGVSAYEYILRACSGKLGAQVDTGWVVCGGEDLPEFLRRNEAYVRSIHHKDVGSLLRSDNTTDNLPLGAGIVDTAAAFAFAKERSLPQLVDQDSSLGDLLDDLAQSAKYISSL